MALVRSSDQRRVAVTVHRVRRPDVAADAREVGIDYSWAGFRAALDPVTLREAAEWRYGVWRLEATVKGLGGSPTSAFVTAIGGGRVRRPERRAVDDVIVVPTTDRGTFAVEIDTVPARVITAVVKDGQLVLQVSLRRGAAKGDVSVDVVRSSGRVVTMAHGEWKGLRRKAFQARLSLAELTAGLSDGPPHHARWALRVRLPQATRTSPLRLAADLPDLAVLEGPESMRLTATAAGRAVLEVGPAVPKAHEAGWVDDRLVVSGSWPEAYAADLVLLSRETLHGHPLPMDRPAADRFALTFLPGAVDTLAGQLPLPQGRWVLAVRRPDGPDTRLRCAEPLIGSLPVEASIAGRRFVLTEDDSQLELVVGSDLAVDERGPGNTHRLRTRDFPAFVRAGLRDEILFESYESRAYGDNARAVLEEVQRRGLGLRCRWVVVDGQTSLPDGVEAVARNSRAYYEALGRSRYLVVPNYRPMDTWYEAPADQVVVQTWHGAPYKRIALDNARGEAFSAPAYAARLQRESARWNWLLSPSPMATPLLRQAFGYTGQVLETGYPRTDVFFAADREQRAATVRKRLDLPAGKKVVLYAPTMRDDRNYGNNRYRLDLRLDLAAAHDALAEDHVLLLRRHAKVVDPIAADGGFARDVSLWPDVNELLLVTDVLVTDYSSLLFDFACTGRPMLFFTYDLADYRDRLRGLYFDPSTLPGPQLATSEEVIDAIRAAPDVRKEFDAVYESFTSRFCPWDDGGAAGRFVDEVFGS
jgi:CDP-glycerol glycerophosphotransferase